MDPSRPTSAELTESTGADLAGMARRHWWLVLLLVLFGIGGALQFTRMQPRVYESATSVLVQPISPGSDPNVVGGRTKGDINLDTEAQLVRSTAVAADAASLLRSTTPADELAANVEVEVPANTSVLVITYRAGDPRTAQAGSHAFAEAYLRNREETARADLAGQIATLDAKLKQLNAGLAAINARLGALRPDNPGRADLESQRSTTSAQINTLASRLNQLTTTTVGAGKIIRDAPLPEYPSKPNRLVNLASGGMVGLLLGVGAAMLRDRLDKRVRHAADVPRRVDVAVLAAVPNRVRPHVDDVFPPFGTGGRIFNRLRNEVLASVPPPAGDLTSALYGQVVVVTGASKGTASTVVAANLAAAFARTGGETVLVCAHLPDSLVEAASVNRMLGVRAMPGLSDVLAGRVPLAAAMQRTPRHPNLRVVTTGGTASAGGLLQSQALRDTLADLRERAVYIVIEAPSTATSADAQSLASLADAAIVAVELRRTRFAEIEDAADQLRRVGTPLLGAVVLPRLATVATDAGAASDSTAGGTANEPALLDDATVLLDRVAITGDRPSPGPGKADGAPRNTKVDGEAPRKTKSAPSKGPGGDAPRAGAREAAREAAESGDIAELALQLSMPDPDEPDLDTTRVQPMHIEPADR